MTTLCTEDDISLMTAIVLHSWQRSGRSVSNLKNKVQ